MKYKLETIPVWDAIEQQEEPCLFCFLSAETEKRKVSFYLGNSVMNPETRVKVNSMGFCPDHYAMLAEAGKPHGVSLMAHTRLQETAKLLQNSLEEQNKAHSPRGVKKSADRINAVMDAREQGCLICESMERSLNRYLYTYIHLWHTDESFRETVSASRGICLYHYPKLLRMAPEVLSRRDLQEFCTAFSSLMQQWLKTTIDDVDWQTQRYKAEHAGKDWRGCEDAHKRAVYREIGKGRLKDS